MEIGVTIIFVCRCMMTQKNNFLSWRIKLVQMIVHMKYIHFPKYLFIIHIHHRDRWNHYFFIYVYDDPKKFFLNAWTQNGGNDEIHEGYTFAKISLHDCSLSWRK